MELEELKSKRDKYLKRFTGLSGWVIGSVVETEQKRNGKRIPFRYLSHSKKGRNSITYIAESQLLEFRKAAENGTKAKKLLEEIGVLTSKIIKLENRKR